MLTLALIAALAAPLAAHSDEVTRQRVRGDCPDHPGVYFTHGVTARAERLGDQPPAKHVLTLWRQVDGCATPIVVRENIGAPRGR